MSYEMGQKDFKEFEGKKGRKKKHIAGGLIAIYPVVNSMVSQAGIALQ